MNLRKQRLRQLALTVVLVALNLIALNFLVSGWSTARLDLTEENLFSISPATERILTGLDEDLTIYGYFSERTHPKLAPLVPELADLLAEYRAVSGGRVHVEILDPGQDEEVENEAAERYGVRGTPFQLTSKYEAGIVNAYFAIVVKYGDQYVRYGFEDLIRIAATPDGDVDVRLRNPEYDLTRAIKKVVFGFRSTNELFERIEEPVRLTAIWTPGTLPEVFQEIPETVRTAVGQLQEAGGERFVFEEIDPTDDEQLQESLYQRFGAQPMSMGFFSDQEFYLYALLEVGGQLEQVVLTGDVTAASVRETIENSLRRHTPGFLKTVGVVTPDPPQIPPQLRMQMQLPPQRPPEFEEVKAVLGQDYQVQSVDLSAEDGVPSNVDVLLVLKPKDLADTAVYNLDQYLMRGGPVIVCAGNYDVDFGANGLSLAPLKTGLEDWLTHHGVTIDQTLVLDDRNQPLPIPEVRSTPFGQMRTWTLAPYPYLVQVRADGFRNPEITASLDAVGIYWGSPLKIDEEATADLEVIPILQSSELSWTDDNLASVGFVDYQVPQQGTEPRLLAAALSGRFKSYYADREVPGQGTIDDAVGQEEDAEDAQVEPPRKVALEESPETRLVVVGDAEFLSDFVARALASVDGGFFVENLRFAQNLIDWSGLDNDMISIRARGMVSRRLERIDRGEMIFIEVINVVVAVGLLAGLAAFLRWKRRQTQPLSEAPGGDLKIGPVSHGEV
jgi:ABC-2 type transport system permease protein